MILVWGPPLFGQTDVIGDFKLGRYPQLSGRLAFSATVDNQQQIFVLDLDAKNVRQLVLGPGNNSAPSWSPDGSQIAFSSDRDGQKEIYLISSDGKELLRITDNQVDDENPSWSSDGKRVLYNEITGDDENSNIFSAEVSDPQPKQITNFPGKNTIPRMSPDGSKIMFSTNRFWPGWDVCVIPSKGGSEHCLLKGPESYHRAAYSPTGKSISFSSGSATDFNVGIFQFSDESIHMITDSPGREYDVAWAPNENYIAFTADRGKADHFDMYLKDLKSEQSSSIALLSSPYSIRYLSWTPVRGMELEARKFREQSHGLKETPVPTLSVSPSPAP